MFQTRFRRRLAALGTAAILVAGLLAGCGQQGSQPAQGGQPNASQQAAPAKAPGGKTLKIGVALGLTGSFSREGNLMKQGYEFWRDKVNAAGGIKVGDEAYKVELIMYDDKSDTNTSVKLTEKLITEDKVNFIFGPYSSGITQATSAVSEKYKVLTFATTANAPALYERGFRYLFGVLPLANTYLDPVLEYAATLNPKPTTVAIISPDNLFALAAMEGAKKKAESLGFQVVLADKYPMNTKDLSTLLSQVKGKNPDLFFCTGFFQDGSLVMTQLKELKWSPKMLGFTIAAAIPDFRKTFKDDAENVIGAEWWLPSMKWEDPFFGSAAKFGEEFKQKYGDLPSYHAASPAVAGYLLQEAIKKAGSLDTDKVRAALVGTEFKTFFGPIRFDERGVNAIGQPGAFQIQKGELVEIWPQAIARAKAVYPRPQ